MAVRHAATRALVALSLLVAAGCGGGAEKSDARDAQPDVSDTRDAALGDLPPAVEAGGDVASPVDGDGAVPPDAKPATDAVDAAPDRADARYPSLCGVSRGTLRPDSAPVTGVLSGVGVNPVVSCGGGTATAGADAAFSLEVETAGIVELVLDSSFDAVLALRTGCAEGVSEIACGRLSLPIDGDASDGGAADAGDPPAPTGPPWRTTLRARLVPGTYTVVVDTVGIREQANPFTLTARALASAPNASCATSVLFSGSGALANQDLSLAGDPSGVCGTRTEATLYYAVGVPSGQRLTVRAAPAGGDRAWIPRVEASATCNAGACLAQGHSAAGSTQVLDWLNNGPNWRLVILSVSADGPVYGARFDLAVNVVDQLATCSRPTPVVNGTTLIGQDVQRAPIGDMPTCVGGRTRALYYSVTLLPQQELTATGAASAGSTPPTLSVRASCDEQTECAGGSSSISYTNTTAESRTVLIEAQPSFSGASTVFDLLIATPPPPAGVSVVAPFGLSTTETGGTAKATLVLRSPPTAPVTITLTSDTPSEGTVSPASLVFNATNWNVAQEVTVTGVDDQLADGSRRYTIVTTATSTDARYKDLPVDDFDVLNLDDDPGLNIEGAQGLTTSEGGATATFKVRLNRQPTGAVRVPVSSSDISEAAVGAAELVFTDANWNVAQEVTVTGVDDAIRDGVQPYTIVLGALVSTDAAYAGQNPPDVAGLNRDDDQVTVGTKILSGDHSCNAPSGRPIATDLAGNIYVVMICDGDLVVTTSTDAGATFSEPQVVLPASNVGEVAIAGGPGGVAYLAYGRFDEGLVFRRTSDGGTTWSAGQTLLPSSQGLRVAAAGDSLFLTASPSDGGNGTALLWRSTNGGRGALGRSFLERPYVELFVRPDGRTVFLVETGPDTTRVRKSTDGGETFASLGEVVTNSSGGIWAMTSTSLVYGGGGIFNAYSLAKLTDSINYASFITSVLALAADERDIVTTIDIDPQTNRLRAQRFDVTATVPAPQAKLIGPYADGAASVALSPRAVATMSWTGNLVLFAVTTWP